MILAWALFPHEKVWTDSPVELISIVSILALLASVLTALYRHWRATECHVSSCHKHQWKEHVEPSGERLLLCRKHHPGDSRVITHEQILAGHAQNQRFASFGSQNDAPIR